MNFGQTGRELLQELKRSEWLPLYSEDAVSRCILVRSCRCLCVCVWSPTPRQHIRTLTHAHAHMHVANHSTSFQECKGHWSEIRQTLEQGEVVSADVFTRASLARGVLACVRA